MSSSVYSEKHSRNSGTRTIQLVDRRGPPPPDLLSGARGEVGWGRPPYRGPENKDRPDRWTGPERRTARSHARERQERAALDSLKYYVAREKGKQDAEALYAYGVSRSRLEEANSRHIHEGITAFNAVIQLDPGHVDAKHNLLNLYSRIWRNEEVLDLAD